MSAIGESIRFYQASSSEMYGKVVEIPQKETTPFHPRSPYGVAKTYAHWITVNYREAYGIFASSGILFNHESPRRGETFVTRKVVRAAARIKAGQEKCLYLGNLDAIRDWGHAKDYVEGMWKILQYKTPDDWVLATGNCISVRQFAVKTFEQLGFEISWVGKGLHEKGIDQNGQIRIEIDSRYFRPTEVPHLLGDALKANELLNWKPTYNIEDLIKEMITFELE